MSTVKEIIEKKGGTYKEEFKKDGRKYVKFICENNHEVIKRTDCIIKTWCNDCQKNSIEDAYNLAKQKGFVKQLTKTISIDSKFLNIYSTSLRSFEDQ